MNGKILYNISDIDFNKDKKLDRNDPNFLFASEINGEGLKRISPANEDLQHFEVIPNSGQILIKTLRDINQDFMFDREDEAIWYKAELANNDWSIEEIIDSTQRKRIENLYFEQWLKRK